jgi:hypothetical protein
MMVQAIPVLQCFSSEGMLYTYLEEEKPGDTKEIKEGKEYLSAEDQHISFSGEAKINTRFFLHDQSAPALEYQTPPPDACQSVSSRN